MDSRGLPGEDHPLNFNERRAAGISGRLTYEEVLGVHRRLAAKQYLRSSSEGMGGPLELPDDLPEDLDPRKLVAVRLPQRLTAYCRARCELEGRTWTSVLEDAMVAYANGIPVDRQKPRL